MLKKKVNFDKVEAQIIDSREKKLRLLGSEIVTGIILRTQKGKDKNNKSFKPYSAAYAKKKKTKVNLTVTGNMLNAISHKNITNGLRFYIIGNTEKQKALININRGRKFFGIDPTQKKWIKKRLDNE